jgi:hypothetical protein
VCKARGLSKRIVEEEKEGSRGGLKKRVGGEKGITTTRGEGIGGQGENED